MQPGNSAKLLCAAQGGGVQLSPWEVSVGELPPVAIPQEEGAVVASFCTQSILAQEGFAIPMGLRHWGP